ncbi:MAG: hypothetical protein AB1512_24040 [Thermodesulfobacteriota bacterium]
MKETSRQSAFNPTVMEIMSDFARLTGLFPEEQNPRRYLWTDAFAVCNYLELYRQTGDGEFRHLALRLVDQVHRHLGRHRGDDGRTGWISGLDEQEGNAHPTAGGLRIGKRIRERGRAEAYDERLEWDRDGQYFHYLTKWMHALHRVSRISGDPTYHRWAIELAKTAHAKFTYVPPTRGQKRLYWKMSIDLTYPLVTSMGQHDPLDGFITYSQLEAFTAQEPKEAGHPDLRFEIADMANICKDKNWATDDLLGLGGLLGDACRIAQLIVTGGFGETAILLEDLLDCALHGLEHVAKRNPLDLPSEYRLAFRELGLSIGLRAGERLRGLVERNPDLFGEKHPVHPRMDALKKYAGLMHDVESFWLDPKNREAASWREHREINMVMLATSLAPEGFLAL